MTVSFARQIGVYYRQPAFSDDVGDDGMQENIHLGERFLQPMNMTARLFYQIGAMAHHRADRAYLLFGAEGCVQETEREETLNPDRVFNIRLASGHVLQVPGIYQADVDFMRLQDFKQRDPVNPRAFHRHFLDPSFKEPLGQTVKVLREGGEVAYDAFATGLMDGDIDFFGPNVDACNVGFDLR